LFYILGEAGCFVEEFGSLALVFGGKRCFFDEKCLWNEKTRQEAIVSSDADWVRFVNFHGQSAFDLHLFCLAGMVRHFPHLWNSKAAWPALYFGCTAGEQNSARFNKNEAGQTVLKAL